jgi:D-alanyl-D-alanine carboxypeptidase
VQRFLVWFSLGLLSAISGLVVSWYTYPRTETVTPIPFQPMVGASVMDTDALANNTPSRRSLLGHWAYEEAPVTALEPLKSNPDEQMRPAAVAQLDTMISDAAAEGIYLVPLSGFRSVEDQQYLFFRVKEERGQTVSTRAEVSAPPGYSEHHTGYAIDLGDGDRPDTNLQIAFEETSAFEWLVINAPRYSFELSFPENNAQGVQYEPWHWRFVGDSDSLETFYQNR